MVSRTWGGVRQQALPRQRCAVVAVQVKQRVQDRGPAPGRTGDEYRVSDWLIADFRSFGERALNAMAGVCARCRALRMANFPNKLSRASDSSERTSVLRPSRGFGSESVNPLTRSARSSIRRACKGNGASRLRSSSVPTAFAVLSTAGCLMRIAAAGTQVSFLSLAAINMSPFTLIFPDATAMNGLISLPWSFP